MSKYHMTYKEIRKKIIYRIRIAIECAKKSEDDYLARGHIKSAVEKAYVLEDLGVINRKKCDLLVDIINRAEVA